METNSTGEQPKKNGAAANAGGAFRLAQGDWPAQAADAIVETVDKVRNRTTTPILKLARAIVFGVFIATMVILMAVIIVVGGIHFLDEVLPFGVWLPYLVLGTVFCVLGFWIFSKRHGQ